MATAAPVKICRICKKDVSNAKRVKDPAGNYYCEACQQKAAAAKKPGGDSSIGLAGEKDSGGEIGFADGEREVVKKKAAAVEVPADVRSGVVVLPAFCPNCEAPVIGTKTICVKCHRDVTKMEGIIKRKAAAAAAGTSTEEVAATWIARAVKVALVVVIAGIVGFVLWGVYLQFVPVVPFDQYPASREALIKEWLGDIALGTDKGYEKAFLLISFREQLAGNDRSESQYRLLFTKINNEFTQKYGADWLSKVTVVNASPGSTDENTEFDVVINGDHHPALVQVQITVEQGVMNMTLRKDRPSYPENGKWRFGMVGLEEYPIHPTAMTGMEERFGRGKPDFPAVPLGGQ